jgi:hypothetical protein
MKFKTLFLSMFGTAAIVSCNNDVVGPNGPKGSDGSTGQSTTATFQLNFADNGSTYAGDDTISTTGRESEISDAALFIYKADGTPEAMAYVVKSDYANDQRVTLRCKDGEKLIFLAVNIGGDKLIKHEEATNVSNVTGSNLYVGKDWNASGTYGPKFSASYTDGDNKVHEPLNSPIWSGSGSNNITIETTGTPFIIPNNSNADNLIKALTGGGDPANGVLYGNGSASASSYYLMSNWDGPNDNVASGTSYQSTCRFKLEPGITSDNSRGATPDETNSNGHNALKINIQRAVAKVSVMAIPTSVQNGAGTGTSLGKFTPDTRWALGNINTSTYPFQIWDNDVVKSTRFNESTAILPKSNNLNFPYKMDNSRWAVTNIAYVDQTLKVDEVKNAISNNTNNQVFTAIAGQDSFALITENNNATTLTHYSSFITFAGQYVPGEYITGVSNVGVIAKAVTPPVYSSIDTMYYIRTLSNGLFFHGFKALAEYAKYVLRRGDSGATPPESDQLTIDYINSLRIPARGGQAPLQAYWHGYCFYRVWISDNNATSPANVMLVRRNHAYRINITKINGPGIGDPNDIIPDPYNPIPIKETDTYVTATVNIMKWHIIKQNEEIGL